MYTTIRSRSSPPPASASSANIGTSRCNSSHLARYAAIIASCAIRPSNSPRNSSAPTCV